MVKNPLDYATEIHQTLETLRESHHLHPQTGAPNDNTKSRHT